MWHTLLWKVTFVRRESVSSRLPCPSHLLKHHGNLQKQKAESNADRHVWVGELRGHAGGVLVRVHEQFNVIVVPAPHPDNILPCVSKHIERRNLGLAI